MPASAGAVFAVSIAKKHRFSKSPQLSVHLTAGLGIEGDAHSGAFVKHRYLARRNPRAPNLRQIHLISKETLDALRPVGYDIGPGELGENITTVGLELECFPLDTELIIGAAARVRLTGLRTPCVLIDRFRSGLKSRLVNDASAPLFKAGVMAVVTKTGNVAAGDPIRTILPTTDRLPLPPL